MQAIITIEMSDGYRVQWEVPDVVAQDVLDNLCGSLAETPKVRKPLEFEPMSDIPNAHVAKGFSYNYVLLSKDYGNDVCLYQMDAEDDFCPVNASRAQRFRRFNSDFGDLFPMGAALLAAQDWDDEVNGWLVNA